VVLVRRGLNHCTSCCAQYYPQWPRASKWPCLSRKPRTWCRDCYRHLTNPCTTPWRALGHYSLSLPAKCGCKRYWRWTSSQTCKDISIARLCDGVFFGVCDAWPSDLRRLECAYPRYLEDFHLIPQLGQIRKLTSCSDCSSTLLFNTMYLRCIYML
jgi:hypothetical protein